MYLDVHESEQGNWTVRLMGANGEPMLTSEVYDSKWNAERAAYNIQDQWVMPIEVKVDDEVQ